MNEMKKFEMSPFLVSFTFLLIVLDTLDLFTLLLIFKLVTDCFCVSCVHFGSTSILSPFCGVFIKNLTQVEVFNFI
jgi:hypothetical protein